MIFRDNKQQQQQQQQQQQHIRVHTFCESYLRFYSIVPLLDEANWFYYCMAFAFCILMNGWLWKVVVFNCLNRKLKKRNDLLTTICCRRNNETILNFEVASRIKRMMVCMSTCFQCTRRPDTLIFSKILIEKSITVSVACSVSGVRDCLQMKKQSRAIILLLSLQEKNSTVTYLI